MPEKLKETLCCGQPANIEREARSTKEGKEVHGIGLWCDTCPNSIFVDESEESAEEKAIDEFMKNSKPVQEKPSQTKKPATQPKKETRPPMNKNQSNNGQTNMNQQLSTVTRMSLSQVFTERHKDLAKIMSPIISGDQGAMDRLMDNNTVRYPLTLKGKAWDKIWGDEVGQQSIIKGIEDALLLGAELGKMGDLVPFGDVCQFIPSVEAFEFALTYGNNAPFEDITIECIYENDDPTTGSKQGNFFIDNIHGKPRGKVESVAVYGVLKKNGRVVGEMYDASRLLDKAEAHSTPYKNYLKIMKAFDFAKSENRVSTDKNGRESFVYFVIKDIANDKYFDQKVDEFKKQESAGTLKGSGNNQYASQVLPKKDGGTWENKIYRRDIEGGMEEKTIYPDELENPYAGADQPEMLRKGAGKSFLGKYAKVRNSEAAMNEARTHESVRDDALKMAGDTLNGESEEV